MRRKDFLRGAENHRVSVRLGNYSASHFEGSAYSGGSYAPINVPGAFSIDVEDINNAGVILGNFRDATGQHGFLLRGGSFTTLDPPGSTATGATGINDAGVIVGYFDSASGRHGFVFNKGNFTTFDFPGSTFTMLFDINNAGEIVGVFAVDPGQAQGFVFSKGRFTPFEVPGSSYSESHGINDAGVIVGYFDNASGRHGFVATPIPTPFTAFTAALELKLAPRLDDAFDLQSRFTLGTGSNGIDPLTEDVTLTLTGGTASFTTTIPAGSFTKDRKGPFTFKGQVEGVKLDATLTALGGQHYAFTAEGKHADLSGITTPVTVILTIGDDSGTTTAKDQKRRADRGQ